MDKAVAEQRSGSSKDMTLLFRKNRKFWSRRGFVRRVPVTWTYSQDLIAKKKAPIARPAVAFSAGVGKGSWAWACMFSRTEAAPFAVSGSCRGFGNSRTAAVKIEKCPLPRIIGAGKTGLHEGRYHMVDGIGYCAGSKLTISRS
jgi:hypothetical protein